MPGNINPGSQKQKYLKYLLRLCIKKLRKIHKMVNIVNSKVSELQVEVIIWVEHKPTVLHERTQKQLFFIPLT